MSEPKKKKHTPPIFLEMANYTAPIITETPGTRWVNYGEDNNYFQYLLDRYRGSPTNHAIINAISDMIVGDGLDSEFAARRVEAYAKIRTMFPYEDLHKFAFDLKCYGWYMQTIVMTDDMEEIEEIQYTPVQNWRSGIANSEGKITTYFYSDDWTQYRKKQFAPRPIPVYDSDADVKPLTSCLPVMPYRSGSKYYPSVDYQGILQYAHLEEEISNFHLNNIMNGLSPGALVNFNNGDPGEEERADMERLIQQKWGGSSNSGRYVLSFNDNKDLAATIDQVEVTDLDKQYQFLSTESTAKIMVGHRITSPYFFGIRDGSGLGSNADEIKNAWLLFERTVLRPYRLIMIDNINYLLNQMGLVIPVHFKDLTPIEFEDTQTVEDPTKIEQSREGGPDDMEIFMSYGEKIDESKYTLIDERRVAYKDEEMLDRYTFNLASTISNKPPDESDQDTPLFLVRYTYFPPVYDNLPKADGTGTNPSRDFCRQMVSAAMGGMVWKKEDIQKAGAVNPGWGPNGANTYDIWQYKGGGSCQHAWIRKTFLREDGSPISVNRARQMMIDLPIDERDPNRFEPNEPFVAQRPRDMTNRAFLKPKNFKTKK